MFKKIVSLSIIAASILVSCSEWEDTSTPGPQVSPDTPSVRFAASNATSFEFDPGTPDFTLTVIRDDSDADIEVPIRVISNTDEVFSIPASVVFSAGEDTVDITIGISAEAPVGDELSIALSFDEPFTNPYKTENSSYYGKVSMIKWVLFKSGIWESADFFEESWEQDLYKAEGQDTYRFYGPYAEGYDIRFIWDGKSKSITPTGGESAVVGGAPVVRYATGVLHPTYGMFYFNIDPDPEYTYFDIEAKKLVLNGAFTVAAGSFGWYDEVFTFAEE